MCFLIGSKLSRDRAVKLHISRPSAWFSSYYIVRVFSRNIVLVCWTKTPESSRCHNSLVYVTKLMIMCRILKFTFIPKVFLVLVYYTIYCMNVRETWRLIQPRNIIFPSGDDFSWLNKSSYFPHYHAINI